MPRSWDPTRGTPQSQATSCECTAAGRRSPKHPEPAGLLLFLLPLWDTLCLQTSLLRVGGWKGHTYFVSVLRRASLCSTPALPQASRTGPVVVFTRLLGGSSSLLSTEKGFSFLQGEQQCLKPRFEPQSPSNGSGCFRGSPMHPVDEGDWTITQRTRSMTSYSSSWPPRLGKMFFSTKISP